MNRAISDIDDTEHMKNILDILYEDNHMICVIKPAGILSQPDKSSCQNDMDMLSIIGEYLRTKYNKPGRAYVGLVHRLDRNVGGTMIFAKTSKGASRLSEEMRAGRFKKGYFALAEGNIKNKKGILINKLYKNEKTNTVTEDEKQGKESVLVYDTVDTVKSKSAEYTLVFAIPVTGRTHQIRAQLAFSGHPLADDIKYGGTRVTNGKISLPALWSAVICVKHPVKEEKMIFKSVPYTIPPWDLAKDCKISEICSEYLKGLNENEFDSLYSIWH